MNLVLSDKTKTALDSYVKHPAHAIGIIGPRGLGKYTIAQLIATQLLGLDQNKLASYPYFRHVAPEKQHISIEQIRDVISFTRLKTTGSGTIRRVILLEDAHTVTPEAQNALLKVIEEPPADTVLLLTIAELPKVLPTIQSRLQLIRIDPPTPATLETYFISQGHNAQAVKQAVLVSGGLPGLMHAILSTADDHPMAQAIKLAKRVLTADTFERLAMIDDITKAKETDQLITALIHIAKATLQAKAAASASERELEAWYTILRASAEAKQLLQHNAQAKMVLMNLFLSLK